MPLSRCLMPIVAVGIAVMSTGIVYGQDYPRKPIRLIANSAGGGNDFVARLIAQGITAPMGQSVVVDNRSSDVPGELLLHLPADGYTLLVAGSSHWLLPYLRDDCPFDPVKDFAPITLAVWLPNLLVVHASVPATSVKELIALAKAKPGVLNYGAGSAGSSNQLAAELFKSMAGVNVVHIAYKGSSAALIDLLGGRVQIMFANAASVSPHIKTERLRALAVTSAQPSALVPGLPTIAASGLPGYEAITMYGVFAPAATPPAIISRLNQEIVKALRRPDIKEKFFGAGVETVGSPPDQLSAAMKSEMTVMGKLIRDAGIRDE